MDPFEMLAYAAKGKILVYIDDKVSQQTPEYLETHALAIFHNMETALLTCKRMQDKERERSGHADTRYILLTRGQEVVLSEDMLMPNLADAIGYITKPPRA